MTGLEREFDMGELVSVAIVGANTIVREGLKGILAERGFKVVATRANCDALAADIPDLTRPDHSGIDIVIIDANSTLEGQASCQALRQALPGVRIVLLGDDFSVRTTSEALAFGADGYLAKEISSAPLAWSLQLVASGEKVVPSQTVKAMMETNWRDQHYDKLSMPNDIHLSDREVGVLRCLTRGDGNKQISRELSITEATVKVHVSAIMRKVGAMNRTQAAMWAVSRGVVESEHGPSAK